jgi:hypothetical protein
MSKQDDGSIQDLGKRDVMAFLYSLALIHGAHSAGQQTYATPHNAAEQCYAMADAMIERGKSGQ